MQMTVDALLRSLRGLAHGVADMIELKPAKRTAQKPLAGRNASQGERNDARRR